MDLDTTLYVIDTEKEQLQLEKYANFYVILDYWLKLLEENKTVASFFQQRGYNKIAIFGMGSLGKHLNKQLENTDINVVYVIDAGWVNYNDVYIEFDTNIERLPPIDVLVITPLTEFEVIRDKCDSKISGDIISIEEVIMSI